MVNGDPGNPGNPNPGGDPGAGDGGGATPAPPPPPASFVFDDNAFNGLPDDLKNDPSVQLFKGKALPDIVKSYVNAQRMVGADKVAIPAGKNDTPEAWNEFYKRLGRPDDPDGYQLPKPAGFPEGLEANPDIEKVFKVISHKLGLTPKQAQELYGSFNQMQVTAFNRQQEDKGKAMEAATETLKKDWGAKYDEKLTIAQKVIDTYGGKAEEISAFKDKFGNDPVAIRILANLGGLISDGNFVKGDSPTFLSTPQEAHKKAMDIMTNKANPLNEAYHKRMHIRHQEAVEEVERLFVVAKGNELVEIR